MNQYAAATYVEDSSSFFLAFAAFLALGLLPISRHGSLSQATGREQKDKGIVES
jgi:hypothetical protein